jgi:HTTM domain
LIELSDLQHAWNTFFHASESCAPQVLFRILFGSLLTLNAFLLFPLLRDFYAVDGMWNLNAWRKQQGQRRLCLQHWLPSTNTGVRLLFWIHAAACVCFLVGWQFRISAVVVFVTLVSIHHRNAFILSSGDTILRLLSFLAMFSAAGDAVSVDAWLADATGFPQVDPWPLRLMQILISIVYLRTVFWKLRGRMWWDGTAAWYPVWVETYLRNRPPIRLLRPPFIQVATWGTLIVELALGSLIWIRELRLPIVIVGICMHLVFEVILNLQLFGWTMTIGLLLFLRPESVEWFMETIQHSLS